MVYKTPGPWSAAQSAWIPFFFCAFIIAFSMFGQDSFFHGALAFLPMCFFGVAQELRALQRRVNELEAQLQGQGEELQQSPEA